MFKGLENKIRAHARDELIEHLAKEGVATVAGIVRFTWHERETRGYINFDCTTELATAIEKKQAELAKKAS